ncbi:MAG: four helix bundle protein [Chitinophagaceae bacterium]
MQELKQRTFEFAVSVGKLILELPYNAVNKAYGNQLVRCSSSVGANYRAARRAKSDADFINKLKIVEEEVDESIYFLELLREFNPLFMEKLTSLANEGTEILKIIVASIITTRTRINTK